MVLKRKLPGDTQANTSVETAAVARPPENDTPFGDEPGVAAPPPAPTPAASPSAPPAAKVLGALAVTPSSEDIKAVTSLKNAHEVQYDSLTNITATQGRFADRDSNTNMGAEIVFELLSYQDQTVVTPNDDKAPKDLVRYSANGVTCSDGTSCTQHLADLKELGYTKARMNSRYILVGALSAAEKTDKFDGQLMQIDLSPKSKGQFDRYLIQSAFDLSRGKITGEQAKVLTLTAEVATNADGKTYTLVKFATYKDA